MRDLATRRVLRSHRQFGARAKGGRQSPSAALDEERSAVDILSHVDSRVANGGHFRNSKIDLIHPYYTRREAHEITHHGLRLEAHLLIWLGDHYRVNRSTSAARPRNGR